MSIDSLNANEHDTFRNAKGSHERAMKAVDIALDAGLAILFKLWLQNKGSIQMSLLNLLNILTKRLRGICDLC